MFARILLVVLITIITYLPSFSQDKEPDALIFQIDGNQDSLSLEDYPQNHFHIGWQWGGAPMMTKAMRMNSHHGSDLEYDPIPDTLIPIDVILLPTVNLDKNTGIPILGQAIQYEPTHEISVPDSFITRTADPTNAVFGFKQIKGTVLPPSDSNDINYNRLLIYQDSLADGNYDPDGIILEDPWMDDVLSYYSLDETIQKNYYNGLYWYITINLRRLDFNDNLTPQDPVLKIKMPYVKSDDQSGYINFDMLPDTTNILTLDYNDNRGIAYDCISVDPTTEFIIRKNMLPTTSNTDITLSAFFICNNKDTTNPYLKFDDGDNSYIDSLKIEVTYLGNCDIAIDWIRIETPRAQELFRGMYDTIETRGIESIRETLQFCLDTIENNDSYTFFRFDELSERGPAYWHAKRYLNRLVNGLATCEIALTHSKHYDYYINPPEMWIGMPILDSWFAAPFFRQDDGTYKTFKYEKGYTARGTGDTLKSDYETYLYFGSDPVQSFAYIRDTMDFEDYDNLLEASKSFQSWLERRLLFNSYYQSPRSGFQYSDKPWWAQIWIGSNWELDWISDSVGFRVFNRKKRPKTGEETRIQAWTPLIMGTKGLVYDQEQTAPDHFSDSSVANDKDRLEIGIGSGEDIYNLFSLDDNFLFREEIGGDFLLESGDSTNLHQFIDFDETENALGIGEDRIYIGRKSYRLELKKIHDWIRTVEDVLMNLRLSASYSHGFKTWQNQDEDLDSAILYKYIAPDGIKTRKIYDPVNDTWSSPYESTDSSFFDVTLLRSNYDSNMVGPVFYIGVQNRRTDPLLYYDSTGWDDTCRYMRFLSTAEFEDSCKTNPDWWDQWWWKRLGCREISIPFNVQSTKPHPYYWLQVTELGYDNDSLNSKWYRDEKYYHKVDTVIARDSALVVRLLPGQGKIFKVAISYSNIDSDGFLDYSNQRKIVAYPFQQDSIHHFGNTDTVRYHMVYTRPTISEDSTSYDMSKMRVYYRRSYPVSKDFYSYQIEWEEEEYCLSDSVYCNYLYNLQDKYIDTTLDCRNPSIVVRFDEESGEAKTYVVYACADLSRDYDRLFLVENVLSANDTSKPVDEKYPYGLEVTKYNAQDIVKWGTPVINASVNGNYYAWPDSVFGIAAGWKEPDDDYFSSTEPHIQAFHWNILPTYEATHPSLNTYSRVRLGEDDCALVWQEKESSSSKSQIYYTRLRMKDDTLRYYLPEYFNNDNVYTLNADSTIVHLSDPDGIDSHSDKDFEYPVLYRGVEDGTFNSPQDTLNLLISHWDRVYWQGTGDEDETDRLYLMTIDIRDTIMADNSIEPARWALQVPYMIWSETENLNYPTAAQGCIRYEDTLWVGSANQGDSVVVLNFIAYPEDSSASVNSQIWNLYHSYWGLYNDGSGQFGEDDTVYNEYRYSQPISARGNHPHLAAMPYMKDRSDWRFNRRIFESGNDTVPNLVSSFQYFMKKKFNPKKAYPFFGFFGNGTKSMLSPVWTIDNKGKPRPLRIYAGKRERGMIKRSDTVNSAWFKIKDIRDIHFLGYGGKTKKLKMYIERKSDGRKFKVPLAEDKADKFLLHKFKLINATNQEYRILWNKLDPDLRFREELVVGGLPDIIDLMGDVDNNNFPKLSEEINQGVIDLGGKSLNDMDGNLSLSVYPNPADQLIYITPYLPEETGSDGKISLSIYSSLGHLVLTQDASTGETVKIPTGQLPAGVYFIKAESNNMSTDNPVKPVIPVIETVIIQR